MTVRTTKKTVTFTQPFTLGDLNEIFAPGTYNVEIDEELLEGLSFYAYRRIRTLVHFPQKSAHSGLSRTLTINPNELDAALKRDAASGRAAGERLAPEEPSKGAPKPNGAENDRRAVDRAEDEGMIVLRH